jgi:hypothetical protein
MTEPATILVVYGIDDEGRRRASRFTNRDAPLAIKAAALLGFHPVWVIGEATAAVAATLPEGNPFACGNSLIRPVRQSVYERLIALIQRSINSTPTQERSDDR